VTCPSAAITTWPLRRTQITVVERIREIDSVVELVLKAMKNLWERASGWPELYEDAVTSISQREAGGCCILKAEPVAPRIRVMWAGLK
jgi:hypothetical protein